ncbi:beta-galactosidase [Amycolatopsis sp. H20-H5]|uniref:beta-galactosidase n=1 Tax=Amycolatopsis sp. H20-H5 TaxID=3046309 RepID=UPI002DB8A26D|nr:beta-galactosidase [Amycolatopsis sp. H20-H5]MEC3982540.1 beta-galactosidase [Amycolatopsis sp. H20-H5]
MMILPVSLWRARVTTLLFVLALMFALTQAPGLPQPASQAAPSGPAAHSVTYDGYSFLVDGKRTYLWSGEFHYYRQPSVDLWRDTLQKMKAAGFNATSLYFDWGYHSPKEGSYDFTGVRDVDKLLDIAAEVGLYVIARPGPYINAEVDGGGFPTWLSTRPGDTRTADPAYLKYSDEWQGQIDRILARHQWVDGRGSVIAYQVENEYYNGKPDGRTYLKHLEDKARADGIKVPLTGNNNGTFNAGDAALDVDGPDSYPQGFDCSNPTKWNGVPDLSYARVPGKPLYTPEFQGGAFDPWGGPGYAKCAQLINDQFANVFYKQNIAVGATAQSFYMLYGGTSWGWSAIPQNYTSYDYGAAITESRQLDPKYGEDKLIGYFTQSVAPLTKTDKLAALPPEAPAVKDTARVNPDTGTQFHVLRHQDSTSTATTATHLALDLGAAGKYPVVPQAPGTALQLNGRQSKILVASYDLGATPMRYSTSEIMTSATIGGKDVAVLYGDSGQAGETVLNFAAKPTVTVLDGAADSTWDAARGDLRLNYTHHGLTRVLVTGGARPLLLLLGDKDTAKTFWRQDTANGPVLVRGTHLLRAASAAGRTLSLSGDTGTDGGVEVFSNASKVRWNGKDVASRQTTSGSVTGELPTAKPITLPALDGWKHQEESPETQPGFDDSTWPVATKTTTNSRTTPATLPVLFADDYDFHTGNTWYRGRFRASGKETGIGLTSQSGGPAGMTSVWLNGRFLGSAKDGRQDFAFPPGSLNSGDNVLSVLTVNMGHEEDYNPPNGNKAARGLLGATLTGSPLTALTWRLQGTRGGEDGLNPVRGPLNTGGLYGERAGWSLPGFPDQGWQKATLPAADTNPGVSWYRTTTTLDLPRGQDTSLGLEITDNPQRHYRALIFVNGWQLGQYLNDVGPQHSFPIPNGVLNPQGHNTIAVAVWNTDGSSGGLGKIGLVNYGSYASSLTVGQNQSPGYDARRYAIPAAPARVAVGAPDTVSAGQQITVSASITVPPTEPRITEVVPELSLPEGWTAGPASPRQVPRVDSGGSATFTWPVTVTAGSPAKVNTVSALVRYRQQGRSLSTSDSRIVGTIPPAPPSGANQVSALPFLSAANGWGPVERDTSNGEDKAGDGKPITLRGKTFPHGLGVHAAGDVQLYLGGRCNRFTATVGVDDETRGGGTIAFRVLVDGRTVTTTPVLNGTSATIPIDTAVTGGQVLDLVVDDGGDGNGNDHGDWAEATLTCT